jgi:hypothetical protein
VAAGYICSLLQCQIARLRRRLSAWQPEDTQRVIALPHVSLALATGSALLGLLHRLFRRKPEAVGQAVAKPASFSSRVMSSVVGHMVFAVIVGNISFGLVLPVLGCILAIPLWMLGWDVKAPKPMQEEGKSVVAKVEEAVEKKFHPEPKEDPVAGAKPEAPDEQPRIIIRGLYDDGGEWVDTDHAPPIPESPRPSVKGDGFTVSGVTRWQRNTKTGAWRRAPEEAKTPDETPRIIIRGDVTPTVPPPGHDMPASGSIGLRMAIIACPTV